MVIRADLLLCDFAQVSDGKLTVIGAGWNLTGPGLLNFGIGLLIEIEPEEGIEHQYEVSIRDNDGQPLRNPDGAPLQVAGGFKISVRPPEAPEGASLVLPLAINLNGMFFPAGQRYQVVLIVDNETKDTRDFSTRDLVMPDLA